MKRYDIRKLWAALALALILCLAAPTVLPARLVPGISAQAASNKVKLNKTKATLVVGQTLKLKLKNAKGTIKWKSSDKSVATVSKKGKVTAKKAGSATIVAKKGTKKYKCKITVKSGLIAQSGELSLTAGSSTTVKINQKVAGKVTIKSSDSKVATAKWKGTQKKGANRLVVKAVKAGTATVTLKNAATKETLKIKVTVAKPAPTPTPKPTPKPNQYFVLENASDANIVVPVAEYSWDLPKSVDVYLYADSGRDDREVTADVADDSIVECYWDYYGWLGDDCRTLYIKGIKPGSTTIKLSNSVNSETLKIKVTVTG